MEQESGIQLENASISIFKMNCLNGEFRKLEQLIESNSLEFANKVTAQVIVLIGYDLFNQEGRIY